MNTEMLSENDTLINMSKEFAISSSKHKSITTNKIKSCVMSVENLQNYKYYEDVESQIMTVLLKNNNLKVTDDKFKLLFSDYNLGLKISSVLKENPQIDDVKNNNEKLKLILREIDQDQ